MYIGLKDCEYDDADNVGATETDRQTKTARQRQIQTKLQTEM